MTPDKPDGRYSLFFFLLNLFPENPDNFAYAFRNFRVATYYDAFNPFVFIQREGPASAKKK